MTPCMHALPQGPGLHDTGTHALAQVPGLHMKIASSQAPHGTWHAQALQNPTTCGAGLQTVLLCSDSSIVCLQVARFNIAVGLPTTLADMGVQDLSEYRLQQLVEACLVPDSTCWNVKGLNADRMEKAIVGADALGKRVASMVKDSMPHVAVPAD